MACLPVMSESVGANFSFMCQVTSLVSPASFGFRSVSGDAPSFRLHPGVPQDATFSPLSFTSQAELHSVLRSIVVPNDKLFGDFGD